MIRPNAAFPAVLILAQTLTACGGGGTAPGPGGAPDDPALPPFEEVERILLPDNTIIVPEDYLGKSFPLLFARKTTLASGDEAAAGVGAIEIVDADTIVLRLPGRNPARLELAPRLPGQSPDTQIFTDGAGTEIVISNRGFAQFVGTGDYLDDAFGLHGFIGFETTVDQRPVTARYNGASSSAVAIVIDGKEDAFTLRQSSQTDLTAVFTGSGGTISGTLFNGSRPADFDGDLARDDRIFVTTTLDGRITPEGFTGTVDATAAVSLDGGPPQDLGLSISRSEMAGKFFGSGAAVASGAYSAEGTVAAPGAAPAEASLVGHFWAENTINP